MHATFMSSHQLRDGLEYLYFKNSFYFIFSAAGLFKMNYEEIKGDKKKTTQNGT